MQIKSYEEAVKYLEGFIGKVRFEITPEFLKQHDPLTRMRALLDLLGNPQEKFKSVLVGGTSGKGSTAYLISHILTTAGYKTGLTISPHLQKINERLQINGEPISDEGFTFLLKSSILPSIRQMSKMEVGVPSYFEILIAMAFTYFAKEKVDIAAVEVGMGGEFDATNTLHPLVAVLTNVSLDHTNVLGGIVQKIARTKVGIIKGSPRPFNDSLYSQDSVALRSLRQFKNFSNASVPVARYRSPRDTPRFAGSSEKFFHAKAPRATFVPEVVGALRRNLLVITGVKQPSVIKIVEDRCKEVGAELFRLRKDFDLKIKKESLEGSVFDVTSAHDRVGKLNGLQNLQFALLGRYQVENASLAIETVLQLRKFACLPAGMDFKVSEVHIRESLKTAFFPGRFEVVRFKGSPRPFNDSSTSDVTQSSNVARQYSSQTPTSKDLFKSSFRGGARPRNYTLYAKRYTLILDGAHNPTKMKAFLTTLKKLYPKERKVFIVGFKFDKDVKRMLKQILQVADILIITEFKAKTDVSNNASADALNLKSQISNLKYDREIKVIVAKNSKIALDKAFNILAQYPNIPAIIVATGSLYLVGEVRNYLTGPDPVTLSSRTDD